MIVCTKCQHHNADTEKFCQRCGSFLEFSGKPVPDAPTLPPPPGGDGTNPFAGPTTPTPTVPTSSVPGSEESTQPVTAVPPTTELTQTGWATPSPDTVTVRPDEAGLDRAYVPTTAVNSSALAPGEIACPTCGAGNQPTRTFCRSCGSTLTAAPVVADAAPASAS